MDVVFSALPAIWDLLKWSFDPAHLISAGLSIFAWLFVKVGWLITVMGAVQLGAECQNVGNKIAGAPIGDMFGLAAWMASPIIPGDLLLITIGVALDVWVLCLALKIVMWVKGLFIGAGA